MDNQIINLFKSIFISCSNWLEVLFSSTSMLGFYLGVVGIVVSIRFILMPLFRGGVTGGSDKVSSRSVSSCDSDSSDED